jgi:hypothetical protein
MSLPNGSDARNRKQSARAFVSPCRLGEFGVESRVLPRANIVHRDADAGERRPPESASRIGVEDFRSELEKLSCGVCP